MRTTLLLAGLALAAAGATPAAAAPAPDPSDLSASSLLALAAQQNGSVRVWMDGNRDFYRENDRMRVSVRTDRDAYLAVFHIDTNGDLDILYPRASDDDGWTPGGRTLTLGTRGGYDYLRVRGGPGMGYVFAVALDEPLELWRVNDLYGVRNAGWDDSRNVFGDPFDAMDEIARTIIPEQAYGNETLDYYTYNVGRRYTYPRYACYDSFGPWYYNTASYYDSCDRVRIYIGWHPHYYDTRYWYGPRRIYYTRYYDRYYVNRAAPRPLHGYKERTDRYAPPTRTANQPRPRPSGVNGGGAPGTGSPSGRATRPPTRNGSASNGEARPGSRPAVGRSPETRSGGSTSGRPEPRVSSPRPSGVDRPMQQGPAQDSSRRTGRPVSTERQRPTFTRRPAESGSPTRRSTEPRSSEPRPSEPRQSQPRSSEPRESEPRRQPERESQPRSEPRPSEPRRSEPRQQEQPRRAEPRQSEPRRSEPRAEPRRSEPSSSRSSGGSRESSRPSSSPRTRP